MKTVNERDRDDASKAKDDDNSVRQVKTAVEVPRGAEVDRIWKWVTVFAWLFVASLAFFPASCEVRNASGLPGLALVCLFGAGVFVLCFVGIPLRIVLNLGVKERRRKRFFETVMCVVVLLVMACLLVIMFTYYPGL